MTVKYEIPEGVYTVTGGERDGLPAIAMLNLAYNDFEHYADYPWLVSITIDIEDQNDAGLPTDAESVTLNAAEDLLEASLAEVTPFHPIARQSWNGKRVLDYYVESGEEARNCIDRVAASGQIPRHMEVSVDHDPGWSSWLPVLQSFE